MGSWVWLRVLAVIAASVTLVPLELRILRRVQARLTTSVGNGAAGAIATIVTGTVAVFVSRLFITEAWAFLISAAILLPPLVRWQIRLPR